MLSTDQKSTQLYKHFLNVADTKDARDFYEESIQSSFCIRPDQLLMYGDEIPRGSNPATVEQIKNLKDGEYFDWQKDETTVIHVVQYHENYPLKKIDDGTDNAFKLIDDNGNLIQNVIPFNYYKDLYNYDLRTSTGKKIYFGVGDWVLDTFSGVLKFYGDVPPGVDHNNPPTISFYQYVGGTGFRQDTFGYDGVIVPINNWHISAGTYIIDGTNTDSDGNVKTLEDQIADNANKIQEGYAGIFGFDGSDKNEGIAYSLQKVISLTYASSLDNVKGYDDSANSDIGTILSRKKATTELTDLNITFCSQNVSVVKEHSLKISGGTVSFDDGPSKTIVGATKLTDPDGNFLIVEKTSENELFDGEYPIQVEEDTTVGLMLYWSKTERDYVPFINNEDDNYSFGFPVVAANGRVPPSVMIGAISLNDYKDTITPEYYGPRNYTVTIATSEGDQVKSADYVVKNIKGFFLDDILKRIIKDYTDENGNFKFIGSIFLRAGNYFLSSDNLVLNDFKNLNFIGEDKGKTKILGSIFLESDKFGLITISNLTISNSITYISNTMQLNVAEVVADTFNAHKGNNVLFLKNNSFSTVKVTDTKSRFFSTLQETSDDSDSGSNEDELEETTSVGISERVFNHLIGSIVGYVEIDTGHTFLDGCTIGTLKLFDVDEDNIHACFIQRVISKPTQTNIIGSTVFKYEETKFSEIPHMKHFPIYSKDSDLCLEYATFADPFEINYSQDGNTIGIKLDSEYLYIDEEGRISCNLNAGKIIVDVNQLRRSPHYEGDKPSKAIPNRNLQEALNDLYSTKADLNPNGKIPLEELPDSVSYGGLLYVGTWSFEQIDNENGKAEENYYVDGAGYPTYEAAMKNLTVDKTQDEGMEPGWFWIVASSMKDLDKPTAVQKAKPQHVLDEEGNVIYEDEGLEFTAGDWVIWNGTNFEKLDRAYQDAAYAVLPIYTTGEKLAWSWKDPGEQGNRWGLGALALGGETIAESFDMINQELRKLWVKHPAVLSNITLEPFYKDYKTLEYYQVSTDGVSILRSVAYDIIKDERVKDFRVITPKTEPKWKSGVFVGDGCEIVATVDSHSMGGHYIPTTSETEYETLHLTGAFDPFTEEFVGSNYWKAIYADFAGKDLVEGEHKFILTISDITPLNQYTRDAVCSTPVFGINTVEKYNYTTDGFKAEIDKSLTTYNSDDIAKKEEEGYCSGVPNLVKPVVIQPVFYIKNAVTSAVNSNRLLFQLIDNFNEQVIDVPVGAMQFIPSADDPRLFDVRVNGGKGDKWSFEFPTTHVGDEQTFSLKIFDVYGEEREIPDIYKLHMRVQPGLDENERVLSGKSLFPTVDTERTDVCGGTFLHTSDLKEYYNNELMKACRDVDGNVVQEYQWPDGDLNSSSKRVSYVATETCDKIVSNTYNGDFRWVTLTKCWNGEKFVQVDLQDNSGFTLDINVASDMESKFTTDLYSLATRPDDFIIMAKFVDFNIKGECGTSAWFNCNAPYDGFSEVGVINGQNAMYAGSSTALSKRITFGRNVMSGTLIFRVGIRKNSGLKFSSLTVRDLI